MDDILDTGTLIVGASHAGVETAAQLRAQGYDAPILLIGAEAADPYERPPLSKNYLKGEVTASQLQLRAHEWYEDNAITLILNTRVDTIDATARTARLSDGRSVAFSKAVLATGAEPRRLALAGMDEADDALLYLRSLADVDRIAASIGEEARIAVIGAGYIGLELAAAARELGHQVTVIEAADRVLARVTGPVVAGFYQREHQKHGVDIRLNQGVERMACANGCSTLILADGSSLQVDLIVAGIGVHAQTGIASAAGLECKNGVLVDHFCQTSTPDILAVGDCARFPDHFLGKPTRLESIQNANDTARIAASTILGQREPYTDIPWFWSDQYDIKLQTVGLFNPEDTVIVRGEIDERSFSVGYFRDDRLVALDAVNSPRDFMAASRLLSGDIPVSEQAFREAGRSLKALLKASA